MIRKDIDVSEILLSEIFHFEIEYDEWPSVHNFSNTKEIELVGYNQSIFDLRNNFEDIFQDKCGNYKN